jgi:hypothetical protein
MPLKAKLAAVAAALILAIVIVPGALEKFLLVSPTPETESTFFRTFTPNDVVQRFVCDPGWSTSGQSNGAGTAYTTNEKRFDQYFAIHTSDWVPMMRLVQEGISSQLLLAGGQILSQSGDFSEGFSVHYKSGNALGVVDVEPLKTLDPNTLGPNGTCKGGIAVRLQVSVEEKWYKKEPKTAAELALDPSQKLL